MRALGLVDLATSRTQSWILSARRKQKVNQVKHGSTNLLDSCSGGRYAGRSVRAKAARGSTRSSSSSSSSMEVDLPPTAALDQQDLLGGQLKRRREAEQECRRLEGENLKLRGSLGDLEAMVAVLEEENAQFGAERERLEGEIEALREQKDEAVADFSSRLSAAAAFATARSASLLATR